MEDMPNKFFSQMWRAIYFNKEQFVGEIQDRKKDGEMCGYIRLCEVNGECKIERY